MSFYSGMILYYNVTNNEIIWQQVKNVGKLGPMADLLLFLKYTNSDFFHETTRK